MFIRVQVIGTGTPRDPYRVPFPTYSVVAINTLGMPASAPTTPDLALPFANIPLPAMTALVEVPGEDATDALAGAPLVKVQTLDVVMSATPDQLAALHAHLDVRYAEHAGAFRPQVA